MKSVFLVFDSFILIFEDIIFYILSVLKQSKKIPSEKAESFFLFKTKVIL